jgi:hypothetical protein
MGEAYKSQKEVILAILPFPEPKDHIAKIEKLHPNVKFIYKPLYVIPSDGPPPQEEIDKDCTLLKPHFYCP